MKGSPLVPVAPFARLIERLLQERANDEGFSLETIAQDTGIPYRHLWGVINGRSEKMEFETADKIVTRTYGPMLWQQDEELNEIYMGLDFTRVDIVNPIDAPAPLKHARDTVIGAYENHLTKREAAKSLGMGEKAFSVLLDKHFISMGKQPSVGLWYRKPECPKGHNKDEVGRESNGRCSECCRIDRQARRQRRKAQLERVAA